MDTSAWEAAGLYVPGRPGMERRLELLVYLSERGATIEHMVEADRVEALPAVAGELARGGPQPMVSIEDVAATTGIPADRVKRVLLAAGLPADEDMMVPDDMGSFLSTFDAGAALLGEEAILAFTRVLGAAAGNIAEAAVALFQAEVGPGTPRGSVDEMELARIAEAATVAFLGVPDVLSGIMMGQFDRATRRSMFARDWVPPAGSDDSASASRLTGASSSPVEIVCLGFVDLVGSTAWAESVTLRDMSLALARFESAAWSSAVECGGRVIKMIGDEVYFVGPTPDKACAIGLEVCRAAEVDPVLPMARGAVGRGPVTPREGDYFGPLVNTIARLVKTAGPGEVLVTEEIAVELKSSVAGWILRSLDDRELRGIENPVKTFAVSVPA